MSERNLTTQRAGAVEWISINRPSALNALNAATIEELLRAVHAVAADPAARCVVITGSGERAFCAGADIAAMVDISAVQARRFARLGQRLMRAIEDLHLPVIAAVNGVALGGGTELALACDFIIAAASARFGQPEINLGIIPGFGGTQRLPRRIGIARAREWIYTGAVIGAEEAARVGLVNRVVADAELRTVVSDLATALAAKAPLALEQAKAAINAGADADLLTACRYEAEAFGLTFATADRAEGMRAFLEKRKAAFRGE